MSSSVRRCSQLSRADLLALLSVGDAAATQFLAARLGLEPSVAVMDEPVVSGGFVSTENGGVSELVEVVAPVKSGLKPEAGFWLLERREATVQVEPEGQSTDLSAPVGWGNRPHESPVYYPLVSPRSLLPRLFQHLKHQRRGREVDVEAVTRQLGRGEYLYHIPRASRRSLGRHLHIIEDHHVHLVPYWLDQGLFADLLESHLPDYASSRDVLVDGQVDDWAFPPEGSVVLVFSDLGALSEHPAGQVGIWLQIGAALLRRGCTLLAVVPCHPHECDPRLRALFAVEPWEPQRQLDQLGRVGRREQAGELLRCLAPVIRLEPGLLRSVRLAANRQGYDFAAGVEAAVWQHPGLQERSSVAGTLNQAFRRKALEAFADLPEVLRQAVLAVVREWRAPLREEVWFEELLSLDENSRQWVPVSDVADARRYVQMLSRAYVGEDAELLADVETRGWFLRMERRLPAGVWELPEVGGDLQRIAARIHQDDVHYRADYALDPARLTPSALPERSVALWQWGERLVVGQPVAAGLAVGGELAQVRLRRGLLYAESGEERLSLQFQGGGQEAVCSLSGMAGVMLRSDVETLYFRQVQRPAWADSMGRDAEGLYVECRCLGRYYRSYWQPPVVGGEGRWGGFPPGEMGKDEHGLYADLDIKGVVQRFRWIKPGTFLMGSPTSEVERSNDEAQHTVTLTQGFWLADSTVTQALWLAVMGNNPSRFSDNLQHPVEQVSWGDVQGFIQQLKSLMPDLPAKLPTEAQWEYACRAGTSTPFSFGEQVSPEQVNYDGNYPYAGGGKGLYREKTVPVKSLPPNQWGLYEMHGNVWEWCRDVWDGTYPPEATDPEGRAEGDQAGVERVVRGGSWFGYGGGNCRSAYRLGDVPDDRNADLGFRLVLGLELQPDRTAERTARTQTGMSPQATGQAVAVTGAGVW